MSDATIREPLEPGEPVRNSEAFRRCLGQFATGVTVITVRSDGRLGGMTSNSFSSLSLDPPLVVWSVRRESSSLELFRTAKHFAVNILAVDQMGLSKVFSRSGENKFQGVDWTAGIGGAPVLDGVVASLECSTEREVDGGDHIMLIGRVLRFCRHDRAPLLFAQGRYARVYEAPDGDSGVLEKMSLPASELTELTTSLIFKAYRAMLWLFEEARKSEHLSYPEVVFLNLVRTYPGRQLENLMSQSAFDIEAGRDLASRLVERELLDVSPNGICSVTEEAGHRLDRIVRRSAEMRQDAFRNLRREDLDATLRVINEIVAQGATPVAEFRTTRRSPRAGKGVEYG